LATSGRPGASLARSRSRRRPSCTRGEGSASDEPQEADQP
jgi:hypothetical protein